MSLHLKKKKILKFKKVHVANGSTKWQVVIATVYQTLPLGWWAFYSCRTWSHRCTRGCQAAGSCTGSPATLCCTNQLLGLVSAGSFPMVPTLQDAISTSAVCFHTLLPLSASQRKMQIYTRPQPAGARLLCRFFLRTQGHMRGWDVVTLDSQRRTNSKS